MDTAGLLEEFHRNGYDKAVAVVARLVGRDEAESAVQEAFVRALRTWPTSGPPTDPTAWLIRVARRCAIDELRRRRKISDSDVESLHVTACAAPSESGAGDATLRQLFALALPPNGGTGGGVTRAMLMLRVVCGLTTAQIAAVFRVKETAVVQRVSRARGALRPVDVAGDLAEGDVEERLGCVMGTVWLVFSAGFHEMGTELGDAMELVDEALRLGELLVGDARTASPAVMAMGAAMHMQSARLGARRDASGRLLSLAEQDRSRWHPPHIDRGLELLGRAANGTEMTEYHLHAGIAACHVQAASYAETDWRRILACYEQLLTLSPTAPTRLGHAVALGHAEGAAAGLVAAEALLDDEQLRADHRLYAWLGELHRRLGAGEAARRAFTHAAGLARSSAERAWLETRAAASDQ
jgi:RNA polymerase sigma-70 factor, ECF subfamily